MFKVKNIEGLTKLQEVKKYWGQNEKKSPKIRVCDVCCLRCGKQNFALSFYYQVNFTLALHKSF